MLTVIQRISRQIHYPLKIEKGAAAMRSLGGSLHPSPEGGFQIWILRNHEFEAWVDSIARLRYAFTSSNFPNGIALRPSARTPAEAQPSA
jgi:hypothetical protein